MFFRVNKTKLVSAIGHARSAADKLCSTESDQKQRNSLFVSRVNQLTEASLV